MCRVVQFWANVYNSLSGIVYALYRDMMRPGIYVTRYGNAAKVTLALTKRGLAKDLDMGELIPLSEVDPAAYVRKIDPAD